jgi:hypothetical protein
MSELFGDVKDLYWASRGLLLVAAGVAVVGAQGVLLLWTFRNLSELSHLRERLSRLADGLALLTDTTEAGLSALLEDLGRLKAGRAANGRPSVKGRTAARPIAAAGATAAPAAVGRPHPVANSGANAVASPEPPTADGAAPTPAGGPRAPRSKAKRGTSTRAGVTRRIALAAGMGERIPAIARREALSESEVRLHLALAQADAAGRIREQRAS